MSETHLVTAFLRDGGTVLLCRRDETTPAPGRWDAITDHAGEDPDRSVRREIREATGVGADELTLVGTDDPFVVEDRGTERSRSVRPFLFDVATRDVTPDSRPDSDLGIPACEWVPPTEIRRRDVVPGLWTAYERVAPTVEAIATDRERGSAALSIDALRVLRDRAGVLATGDEEVSGDDRNDLASFARDLRDVRPSMVVIANRVNGAMATADDRTPRAIERAAQAAIERAAVADGEAAGVAAVRLADRDPPAVGNADGPERTDASNDPGPRVFTLSRSGTVLETLRRLTPSLRGVVVAESRPGGEGRVLAAERSTVHPVTLVADAAAPSALEALGIDAVLVGADTIFPNGSVLNKVGTRGVALAAAHEDVSVYVVAASAKISPDSSADPDLEVGHETALYDGDADVEVWNPTFDVTPADAVTAICTERGALAPAGIAAVAEEFAALSAWDEE